MVERSIRVLLITDDRSDGERVGQALLPGGADGLCVIDRAESMEQGLARADDEVDVIVVASGTPDRRLVQNIEILHRHRPLLPIIVLAEPLDEPFSAEAIRAGALHCLSTGAALLPRVVPIIVDAAKTKRESNGAHDGSYSEDEFGTLRDLCGPVPSPVSARSFGMRPLAEKFPDNFHDLARDYTQLLRRAIEATAFKAGADLEPDLNRMAERLGILSAGPRDLIDMHKVAISAIVASEPPLRAKAFIEEGRLFLLRLMGYLLGFYRMLSWGRPLDRQGRLSRLAMGSPPSPGPSEEV